MQYTTTQTLLASLMFGLLQIIKRAHITTYLPSLPHQCNNVYEFGFWVNLNLGHITTNQQTGVAIPELPTTGYCLCGITAVVCGEFYDQRSAIVLHQYLILQRLSAHAQTACHQAARMTSLRHPSLYQNIVFVDITQSKGCCGEPFVVSIHHDLCFEASPHLLKPLSEYDTIIKITFHMG